MVPIACRMSVTAAFIVGGTLLASPALGHDESSDHNNAEPLHFTHPLFTESPSPDTKLRLDYFFADQVGETGEPGADLHTARLEGEYAFSPNFSIEVNLPYSVRRPAGGPSVSHFDSLDIGFKYADYRFQDRGLLLGGGLEFGLPTGSDGKDIGSSHAIDIEPFVDFGYRNGSNEAVGFLSLGLPVNEKGDNQATVEVAWNLSLMHHSGRFADILVEFDGQHVAGGAEDGTNIISISPGIRFHGGEGHGLALGIGIRIPVSNDRDSREQVVISLFRHF